MTDTTDSSADDMAARIVRLEACSVGEVTIADCLTLAIHWLAQGLGVEPPILAAVDPIRIHGCGWPDHGAAKQRSPSGRAPRKEPCGLPASFPRDRPRDRLGPQLAVDAGHRSFGGEHPAEVGDRNQHGGGSPTGVINSR
jgi:hypothetical protein